MIWVFVVVCILAQGCFAKAATPEITIRSGRRYWFEQGAFFCAAMGGFLIAVALGACR